MANINVQNLFTQAFEIYLNDSGSERMLGIGTLDLPEISNKTVDISGTGMAGEVSAAVPSVYESGEATIHMRTIDNKISKLSTVNAHDLTFRSAQSNYDAGTGKMSVQGVKINMRGFTKKVALGKFESASETETEVTFEYVYLKITVDGTVIQEIDKFNYIDKRNGVDQLAATRTKLGL